MSENMNTNQKIGIDKITLFHFGIDYQSGIDIPYILSLNNVTYQTTKGNQKSIMKLPNTDLGISSIKIIDNQIFSDLVIGTTEDSCGHLHTYSYLTITVDNVKGDNLESMLYSEYNDYLECVFIYIENEYKIKLYYEEMKIKYIEINVNIPIEKAFSKYNRSIRLLMSLLNKRYGKLSTYESLSNTKKDKTFKGESYRRGNKSIQFVIYDKTQQMLDRGYNSDEENNYLRMEYRLLNEKQVKKELGTNEWALLSDDIIYKWFYTKVNNQLINPLREWKETRKKDLLKLIKQAKKKNPKSWHKILLLQISNNSELYGIPYILDIEQVFEVIKELPNSNRFYNRTINVFNTIKIENDVYRNHDINKINELIYGISQSYINSSQLVCMFYE